MDALLSAAPFELLADAAAASSQMRDFVMPFFKVMTTFAALSCAVFLIIGGYRYITSAGNPDRLDGAKKVIRNALIGLMVVLVAGALTAILSHAYSGSPQSIAQELPRIEAVTPKDDGLSPTDVIIKGINGLLANILETIGKPITDSLSFFTNSTPLMANNSGVFGMWLVMVAIADVLFILVVALLGFHIMSAEALGLDEIEFKHLLPQIGLTFLLLNTSIFAIDAVISLSNAMIDALKAGFDNATVWSSLSDIISKTSGLGVAALLIMVAFIILAAILVVYYLMRLVVLFLGAVLSPLVVLLWLLPSFRDFAATAIRTYLTTIFVLFVHVVILMLASTLFKTLIPNEGGQPSDPLLTVFLGIATLLLLLKTQGMMTQLSFMSSGAKSARKLGTQFTNGMSHLGNKVGAATKANLDRQIQEVQAKYVVNRMASQ